MTKANTIFSYATSSLVAFIFLSLLASPVFALDHNFRIDKFQARIPLHIHHHSSTGPSGYTPQQIWQAYSLPGTGGNGTIAIIDAYDDPNASSDINKFSLQFNLPTLPNCTSNNSQTCFEKHKMSSFVNLNRGWALEESLDSQWAHAIAPNAHILLVEARSASGNDLLNAISYARNRSDVTAISMSWGGTEFSSESLYDSYFTSNHGISFFASSGDNGFGVQWPSVSPNIIAVGGTTLTQSSGQFTETAWSGSGGGISLFEKQPLFQTNYGIPSANNMRAVPDVSYDADPYTGYAVYDSTPYFGMSGWFQVGGTSAGAPQWAAIKSLGTNVNNAHLYTDAVSSTPSAYFRDITTGSNGSCNTYCSATAKYDYVTGLGSPLTISF